MSDGSGEPDQNSPNPETELSNQPPPDLRAACARRATLVTAGLVCGIWGGAGAVCASVTDASWVNGYVCFAAVSVLWILTMLREGRKGTFRRRPGEETPEPEVVGAVYGAIFIIPAAFVMGVMSLFGGARIEWNAVVFFVCVVVFGPFAGAALGAFCGNLWKVLVLRPDSKKPTK